MKLLRGIKRWFVINIIKSHARISKGWRVHYSKKLNVFLLLNLDNYIDFLIYRRDHFEPEVLKAIKYYILNNNVTSFVDVGSNIGQMSLYVAKNFPDVNIYSFEAFINNYRQQMASMLLNNLDYELNNIAISDSEEDLILYLPKLQDQYDYGKYNSGMPSINLDSFRDEKTKITVPARTLDNIFQEKGLGAKKGSMLIKIDVEGAELKVILGLENFLKQHSKIIIIIEMLYDKDKNLYDIVRKKLLMCNFKLFDIHFNALSENSNFTENADFIFIKE